MEFKELPVACVNKLKENGFDTIEKVITSTDEDIMNKCKGIGIRMMQKIRKYYPYNPIIDRSKIIYNNYLDWDNHSIDTLLVPYKMRLILDNYSIVTIRDLINKMEFILFVETSIDAESITLLVDSIRTIKMYNHIPMVFPNSYITRWSKIDFYKSNYSLNNEIIDVTKYFISLYNIIFKYDDSISCIDKNYNEVVRIVDNVSRSGCKSYQEFITIKSKVNKFIDLIVDYLNCIK